MRVLRMRGWMFGAVVGAVIVAGLAAVSGVFPRSTPLAAQTGTGEYWLIQPGANMRVGRVWCNGDRSIEYWAYVDGVYTWADASHGVDNHWRLDAEYIGSASYSSFQQFKDAVCALPIYEGQTITFQAHGITEDVVEN